MLVNLWDSVQAGLVQKSTITNCLKQICDALSAEYKKLKGKPSANTCIATANVAMANLIFSDRNPIPIQKKAYTVTTFEIIKSCHVDDESHALAMCVTAAGIPNDSKEETAKKRIAYVKSIASRAKGTSGSIMLRSNASLRSAIAAFWVSSEIKQRAGKTRDWMGLIHRKNGDFLCRYAVQPDNIYAVRPTQLEGGGKRFAVRSHSTLPEWGQAVDLAAIENTPTTLSKVLGGTESVCREIPLTHKLLGTLNPIGYPDVPDRGDTDADDEAYLKLLLAKRNFSSDIFAPLVAMCPIISSTTSASLPKSAKRASKQAKNKSAQRKS